MPGIIMADLTKTQEELRKMGIRKKKLEEEMMVALQERNTKKWETIHDKLCEIIEELAKTKKRLKILVGS